MNNLIMNGLVFPNLLKGEIKFEFYGNENDYQKILSFSETEIPFSLGPNLIGPIRIIDCIKIDNNAVPGGMLIIIKAILT